MENSWDKDPDPQNNGCVSEILILRKEKTMKNYGKIFDSAVSV